MKICRFAGCAAVLCELAAFAQPAAISYVYGNGQMGPQLTTIAPIVVQVVDQNGKPVANSPVTWTVTQGVPAAFTPPVQTTSSDANGYASSYLPAYAVDPSQSFNLIEVTARGVAGGPVKFLFTSLATGFTSEVLKPGEEQNRTINTTVGSLERAAFQVSLVASDGPQAGQPIPGVGLRVLNVLPGLNTSGFYDFQVGNDPRLPSASCINNTLSDANGTATCDLLIGPRAGSTKLYVLVGEDRLMPVLTLNVSIGPSSAISITLGDGQAGAPGQGLGLPLSVHVTDSGGNPTGGVQVAWTVLTGTATLSANVTATDNSGNAANHVTLGSAPGQLVVRAQVGTAAFVDFHLTSVFGVSSLLAASGDDQAALVSTPFPSALVVQAVDGNGTGVAGVPVQFSASGSGVLGVLSAATNASGFTSTTLTAGSEPGPITVTATAQGFQARFVKLAVYPPGPHLEVSAIRNSASGELGLTPCGLATLTGAGLAPGVNGVLRGSATSLAPLDSITAGGTAALIREVSNVEGVEAAVIQAPCDLQPGQTEVVASVHGVAARVGGVNVSQYQPGVFEVDDHGQKIGWANHGDGSPINSASPAARGEVIRVFGTGLGPPATDQSGPEKALQAGLVLGINDAGVPMTRSGYLSNQPGLYFVELALPVDFISRDGHVDFVIALGALYSNTVAIPAR